MAPGLGARPGSDRPCPAEYSADELPRPRIWSRDWLGATDRLLTTRQVARVWPLARDGPAGWRCGQIPGGIRIDSIVLRFREAAIKERLAELEEHSAEPANTVWES